jgi:hypothetical protein
MNSTDWTDVEPYFDELIQTATKPELVFVQPLLTEVEVDGLGLFKARQGLIRATEQAVLIKLSQQTGTEFPHQRTLDAIAASTKINGDHIEINVDLFQETFNKPKDTL